MINEKYQCELLFCPLWLKVIVVSANENRINLMIVDENKVINHLWQVSRRPHMVGAMEKFDIEN